MKKSRLQGFKDYMAVIIRRKWWILAAFIIFAGFAGLFAAIVPDIYISDATILIQPKDISSDLVPELIDSNTEQRLSIIEARILSRNNLQQILEEFKNELGEYQGMNDQLKVRKLAEKINIEFPTERIRGQYLPITKIIISYRDKSQELAKNITSRLTTLFIEQDNKVREDSVYGTTEFLSTELEKVEEELRQSDAELQTLKSQHRYEMPEQQETNLRTLDRLQDQQRSNLEALDRSVEMKLNLERQLLETPAEIPKEEAIKAEPNKIRNPILEAYRQKEREYKELIATKTETHPGVRRLVAEMQELKKDIPEEALDTASEDISAEGNNEAPEMVPNPAHENLMGQLQDVNRDIDLREREKDRIVQEIALYNRRVANTPKVAEKLAEVRRVNEALNKRHDSLKEKLDQAKLGESAETRQKGTQFKVLDAANYPLAPAPPSKTVIFLIGMAISLALGVGVAFVVDLASPVVFTQSELERVLQEKVFVEIPRITTPSDIRKNRIKGAVYAALFLLMTGLYSGCLYLLYQKQSKLVQILEPVIQRIQG